MNKPLNTIIDNRGENTVLHALKRLLPESTNLDVATGYFEIGSLLSLEKTWNELQKIRVLMGDETTKRTKKELVDALRKQSEESIEREKEKDDSLTGLASVRQALERGQIDTRIFRLAKFHAKSYLMQAKPPSPVHYGIVGSSNFTEPGLCRNLELNLFTTEQNQLHALQTWFDGCWSEAEDVRDEVVNVIEPHLKLYSPFDVYAKALYEYYYGKEMPTTSWEETSSTIYPILDDLQKTGYRQAMWIAEQWGGALICDGVGFGKTYIALMLIERFIHERKRVAIIVPKSARESVWENRLRQYLNYDSRLAFGGTEIELLNHTDLAREKLADLIQSVRKRADVVIVDEGHHFRTTNTQRSEKLFEMLEFDGVVKKIFFLTATPVNNSLFDILHLMEFFTRKKRDYFKKLGINDTRTYFVKKETAIDIKMGIDSRTEDEDSLFPDFDVSEAEKVLRDDVLFRTLVIQRSRDYAKRYFKETGDAQACFPERDKPTVAEYRLAKVYQELFPRLKKSFSRETPFLELKLYNPENNRRDKNLINPKIVNREKQVLMLIRMTMLKRMESSYKAFEASCEDMLRKMARFLRYHDQEKWIRWRDNHEKFWGIIEQHWKERFQDEEEMEDVEEDDLLPEPKQKLLQEEYFLDEISKSVLKDMDELTELLMFIHARIMEETDDKLRALVELINNDKELKTKKVIIFTQYRDTARYLLRQLRGKITDPVEELDSTSKKNRDVIIKRFSPYYNCTPEELPKYLAQPIRVLISTDVLSEGLNLQDAHLLINYDIHWNPVRLMQRIGRVDRRLNPEIEKQLGREQCIVRFWNFLPPDELEEILRLYQKISGKVLRISKTMGIEGKQLLTPEDDFESLRDFNASYNGVMSFDEKMRLMYEEILKKYPHVKHELALLPKRLFSGKDTKEHIARGVFAAYRYPKRTLADDTGKEREIPGECRWYFHRYGAEEIVEDVEAIHALIEANPETPRIVIKAIPDLRESLLLIERKKVNMELRNMQALSGEKATLVCWMEIS